MASPAPFSRFEFMIAWRYLRARRAEGGVSVMTWISLLGITLGVMALIATLAVRAGFRAEFVDTILGANAHSTVYYAPTQIYNELTEETYVTPGRVEDYDAVAARIAQIPGVIRAVPAVRAQVMARQGDAASLGDVHGITLDALKEMSGIADPQSALGNLDDFDRGIAIGIGMARDLGLGVGDRLQLVAPEGAKTPFGTTPRVESFEVVYIFSAGRYDVDKARVYMPMAEAQSFFNREGQVDEIGVYVADPERIDDWTMPLLQAAGERAQVWTWRDASGSFLAALDMEDDVMFIILSILVLIASMNITSGLIMLVKNKGRDIGILRTMGLTEGSVLRVFFLCGAFTGVIGTIAGVALGVALSLNVDHIMAALNALTGGNAWQPEVRGIYHLTAELRAWDIFRAAALSLALSFVVTIFPARRAARMNPVEALRYE
ncbi:lipoprotein-releasing ABC transporter permease subunit (plasmid) [Paracoccus versutus]|uniref:Lipoprotein-releasing system permease protein n=1 Tax=Paracoccus versutus TaxID=34007 RepID=A0AAQ0KP87_PARVE|nr:lipoprotein-releasing ABC transporter permease subunit [Paracoccus versutus]KGJ12498.1 ABC transporter substrate-binding protein [Paracoccus versutus]REG55700.1 lipoprotein-releasing system permease protein [Paracoccus versutus]WEJ81670.1 lipoprotein-releasing ABC transporter permease subunit [Paracoccus versutus]SFX04975.1 lipoprotein-releasing system permease protein [Paracoccus pantotrophus]